MPAMRRYVLLLAAALGACGDAESEPEPAPIQLGIYELVRTGAGEIPALLGTRKGCDHFAAGGHVQLLPQNQFEAMMFRTRDCATPEAGADTVFQDRGRGIYEVAGDSLIFSFPMGASAGVGRLKGDTLVVQGPGQTLYYVRRELPAIGGADTAGADPAAAAGHDTTGVDR